jgi:hypothetical protein
MGDSDDEWHSAVSLCAFSFHRKHGTPFYRLVVKSFSWGKYSAMALAVKSKFRLWLFVFKEDNDNCMAGETCPSRGWVVVVV